MFSAGKYKIDIRFDSFMPSKYFAVLTHLHFLLASHDCENQNWDSLFVDRTSTSVRIM